MTAVKQFVDRKLEIRTLEREYAKNEAGSINRNLFLGEWWGLVI